MDGPTTIKPGGRLPAADSVADRDGVNDAVDDRVGDRDGVEFQEADGDGATYDGENDRVTDDDADWDGVGVAVSVFDDDISEMVQDTPVAHVKQDWGPGPKHSEQEVSQARQVNVLASRYDPTPHRTQEPCHESHR